MGRWSALPVCARADRRAGAAGVGRGFGRGERGAEKGRAAQSHRLCFWRAIVERASAHEVRPLAAGQVPLTQDAAALRDLAPAEIAGIRQGLEALGYECVRK